MVSLGLESGAFGAQGTPYVTNHPIDLLVGCVKRTSLLVGAMGVLFYLQQGGAFHAPYNAEPIPAQPLLPLHH